MASKHVSLLSAFLEGDPIEWFRQFEIFSAANDWDDNLQGKMLTFLDGEALAVWLDLSKNDQKDYNKAKKISDHVVPMSFVFVQPSTSSPLQVRQSRFHHAGYWLIIKLRWRTSFNRCW